MPYFKQGDDLSFFLNECENDVSKALGMYADMLNDASNMIVRLNSELREMGAADKVNIDADTHMIIMTGPEDILQALLDKELASPSFFDEDEDYE